MPSNIIVPSWFTTGLGQLSLLEPAAAHPNPPGEAGEILHHEVIDGIVACRRSPQEFVDTVNPIVAGWVSDFWHTHASQAFRTLLGVVNSRLRRCLS